MPDIWTSVGTNISKTPVFVNITYRVIILSVNYRLPIPVCSLIILTWPNQKTAHKGGAGPAINDKRYLTNKIRALYHKTAMSGVN